MVRFTTHQTTITLSYKLSDGAFMNERLTALTFAPNVKQASASQLKALVPDGVNDKSELLMCLRDQLHFPEYFGMNWDALDECLKDFNWTAEKDIIIVHNKLPDLGQQQTKDYLEILADAVLHWKRQGEHVLTVVFPETERAKIESFL